MSYLFLISVRPRGPFTVPPLAALLQKVWVADQIKDFVRNRWGQVFVSGRLGDRCLKIKIKIKIKNKIKKRYRYRTLSGTGGDMSLSVAALATDVSEQETDSHLHLVEFVSSLLI